MEWWIIIIAAIIYNFSRILQSWETNDVQEEQVRLEAGREIERRRRGMMMIIFRSIFSGIWEQIVSSSLSFIKLPPMHHRVVAGRGLVNHFAFFFTFASHSPSAQSLVDQELCSSDCLPFTGILQIHLHPLVSNTCSTTINQTLAKGGEGQATRILVTLVFSRWKCWWRQKFYSC